MRVPAFQVRSTSNAIFGQCRIRSTPDRTNSPSFAILCPCTRPAAPCRHQGRPLAIGRQAHSSIENTQAYPRDEHCQSSVGSASDPWRTPQARRRYRQTSVAKYMVRRRDPPSKAGGHSSASTLTGSLRLICSSCRNLVRLLYGLLTWGTAGDIFVFGVTAHPTAEWIANQVTEASGGTGSRYLFVTGTGPMVRSLSADSDR